MPIFVIFIALALLLLAALWQSSQRFYRPHNFPPGPWQLPFIGNLLEFRASPLRAMINWQKKYGKIVGLRLGSYRYVMISDYEVMKEAFTQDAFNGRPEFKPTLVFAGGSEHGTVVSAGDSWDTVRRFTIKHLNALGFGKKSAESCVMFDINNVMRSLETPAKEGKPIQLSNNFVITATSSLWKILVGKYIKDEEYFKNCLTTFHKIFWQPIGNMAWQLTWASRFFPTMTGYNKQKTVAKKVHNLVSEEVESHLSRRKGDSTKDDSSEPESKDLMSQFIKQITNTDEITTSNEHGDSGFWYRHMKGMISNLFLTSAEAMTNAINWTTFYLAMHPEAQSKLYEEIQAVIGENTPSLSDQANMPYAQAVMKEVLRLSTTSPFSNFQLTTKDVTFHGYFIPKDTIIIGNLFGVHHDEKLYPNVEHFNPERFLGENSSTAPWIPFGVGLRTCLGQTYSKSMFFLMLTTLFQNYEIVWDPARKKLTEEEIIDQSHVSVFRFCPEYKVVLKKRIL